MSGGAGERLARHERLLFPAEGAGSQHPAERVGEPGGDPAARHRLHLRPADRAAGGGGCRAEDGSVYKGEDRLCVRVSTQQKSILFCSESRICFICGVAACVDTVRSELHLCVSECFLTASLPLHPD